MDEVDLVLLLEEAGRAALPEPLVDTALLLPLVPAEWQEPIASGLIALGVAPADATHVVGPIGRGLHRRRRPGLRPTRRASTSSARSTAPAALAPGRGRRSAATACSASTGDPFDRMAFGTAATLVGVARHLIDVTVDYAKERQQFGQPIGGFQAVKHHLASALLAVEFAAPAVYRAAWSLATDQPDVARDVSMAKAMAGDAAEQAARVALQVHGAIGYTFESDLHLWMKRVWALSPAWGDAAWHRRRVADAVIG